MKYERKGLVQIDLDELDAAIASAVIRSEAHTNDERRAAFPSALRDAQVSLAPANAAQLARSYLKSRRERERLFPPDLFGEAAWDIMLDLFAAQEEGKQISISSACLASSVPTTTALRWINKMLEIGLLKRTNDRFDHRKSWLQLTDNAARHIEGWLLRAFAD